MTFFECFADETLLKAIGFKSKELSGGHSFGRSKVSNRLKKASNSLGLIDEDPGAARDSYLKYLFELDPIYSDGNLRCIKDKKSGNKIIVVRPSLEPWIVKIAKECKIDLSSPKYSLSMNPEELYEALTPKENVKKREKFMEFINDASTNKSIVKLKAFI